MSYLAFSGIGYINFGQLNEACNFNIYEFRILSSSSYDVQFLCTNCTIIELVLLLFLHQKSIINFNMYINFLVRVSFIPIINWGKC